MPTIDLRPPLLIGLTGHRDVGDGPALREALREAFAQMRQRAPATRLVLGACRR